VWQRSHPGEAQRLLRPGDSQRLELLRFPLILFVVYLHATAMEISYGDATVRLGSSATIEALKSALSGGIQRTAVPLFFLFAGYLFFLYFDGSAAAWRAKLRRRLGTLLLPYLFWNGVIALLFLIGAALPSTSVFFNAERQLSLARPLGVLDALLGVTRYPIVYPMWFLRDLMVLVLFALPLHALLVRTRWLLPCALVALWVVNRSMFPNSAVEAATFFVAGAMLAFRGVSPFGWERRLWLFGPLWLVLFVASPMLPHGLVGAGIYRAMITAGVLTVLCLPGHALRHPRLSAALTALAPASFFVFAAHEPLMTLVRKLLFRMLPPNPAVAIAVYVLLPLAIVAFAAALYFLLRRAAPRLTALISGNRVSARGEPLPKY
jgi:peptidoglycan/LPS O-acetylase OafA/YrhL